MILGRDPRQLQLPFALWTRETVGALIEAQFGVVMSEWAVGRLLRKLGFSPQRPTWRAYESDDEAVKQWKTVIFPAIRAEAKEQGAVVLFQDEASVRSDFHAGTTWGLVGVTPVVRTTGARYSVNMISSVSAQGKLHFRVIEGTVDADVFISYLQALLEDIPDRKSSSSSTATQAIGRRRPRSGSRRQTGAFVSSSSPATHLSSTRTSGPGRA